MDINDFILLSFDDLLLNFIPVLTMNEISHDVQFNYKESSHAYRLSFQIWVLLYNIEFKIVGRFISPKFFSP